MYCSSKLGVVLLMVELNDSLLWAELPAALNALHAVPVRRRGHHSGIGIGCGAGRQ